MKREKKKKRGLDERREREREANRDREKLDCFYEVQPCLEVFRGMG